MKLINLILILLLSTLNLYSQEFPKVEDYQIKGFENINFKNVLLGAESDISNFYAITDDGRIYDIKNMGHNPIISLLYQIEGDISEAFTYDSLHYLSLITADNTYLIRTKDFIDIDTIYSEVGFEINDFQIYNSTISMIVNNGVISKVISRGVDATQWEKLGVPEYGYNRLATLKNNYYLYKYLNDDMSILKYEGDNNKWNKIDSSFLGLLQLSEIKTKDTIMFAFGKHNLFGNVVLLDDLLGHPSGRFWTPGAPARLKTCYDLAFDWNYGFPNRTHQNYQVGAYYGDSVGAYLHKSVFQGDAFQNRRSYSSSNALRRVISSDFNQHKEFVAVGHNGIVLLINRGLSDVETQIDKEDNISLYPNPAIKTDEITINSIDVMKSITVTDLIGKVLFSLGGINKLEFQLPISELPSATYFIRIETNIAVVSKIFNVVR